MLQKTKDRLEYSFKFLTLVVSVVAFLFTIRTWKGQTNIKRAEFLENKITEFETSSTYLARMILDSFAVSYESNDSLSNEKLVDIGSSRTGNPKDIGVWNLKETLAHEWPVTENSEQRVRRSFDSLLDFFGKLEYYASLSLLTKDEVSYFKYYLEKCAKSKAVIDYAGKYGFSPSLALLKRMGIQY